VAKAIKRSRPIISSLGHYRHKLTAQRRDNEFRSGDRRYHREQIMIYHGLRSHSFRENEALPRRRIDAAKVIRHQLSQGLGQFGLGTWRYEQTVSLVIDQFRIPPRGCRQPGSHAIRLPGEKGQPFLAAKASQRSTKCASRPQWLHQQAPRPFRSLLEGPNCPDGLDLSVNPAIGLPPARSGSKWSRGCLMKPFAALMRTSSIFAMPSLQEGLGLSLQEALWHGCPAVGSRVGGIPELIDHQRNGLLITPGSESELAEAVGS